MGSPSAASEGHNRRNQHQAFADLRIKLYFARMSGGNHYSLETVVDRLIPTLGATTVMVLSPTDPEADSLLSCVHESTRMKNQGHSGKQYRTQPRPLKYPVIISPDP